MAQSIVAYFRTALYTEGYHEMSFMAGDPEDKIIMSQVDYAKLTAAQKRDTVYTPLFVMDFDSVGDGRDFGIGENETWVHVPGAIDIYAESPGQRMSIGDFIQETLEDTAINWYDYSLTESPGASELQGTIDFENITVRFPKIMGTANKAMKHWAHIGFMAKVSRTKA